MSRKRSRIGGGGAQQWDALPWKALEPPLERDDGWQSMGGEEQALIYTLEEISGSDYCIQGDTLGGSQMVPTGTTAPADTPGATPTISAKDDATTDASDNNKNGPENKTKNKKGKGNIKKASAPKEQPPPAAAAGIISAAAAAGKTPADSPASAGDGDTGDGEDVATATAAADDDKRPKKKRRRGQGKKKRAAEAAAARAAGGDGGAVLSGGGDETVVPSAARKVDDRSAVGVVELEGSGVGGAVKPVAGGLPTGKKKKKQQQQQQQQHAGEQTAEGEVSEDVVVASAGEAEKQTTEDGKINEKKKNNKKNKKKKNKKKKTAPGGEKDDDDGGVEGSASDGKGRHDWELGAEDAAKMAPWMYLGVELHPALLWHLHRQGFHDPTPIQRRVLPKAVLGRKDIIGAAETGSGKTLAFGLPVLSEILTRRDAAAAAAAEEKAAAVAAGGDGVGAGENDGGEGEGLQQGLQALVLCPTRELALQVAAHLREVVRDTGVAVVAVVGGLAEVKQQRQLSRRPEVVVATPGRFWEMAGTHAHLSRLETLRHLVVDEADRMLEKGHYPELNRLFSMLEKAEGRDEEEEGQGGGARGRSKNYRLPFDIGPGGEWSVPLPEDGASVDAMDESGDDDDGDDGGEHGDGDSGERGGGNPDAQTTTSGVKRPAERGSFARQTYVFSATLTLGASGRQQRKGKGSGVAATAAVAVKGKKGRASGGEDDPVTKIMKRVGVRGDPAVIDMGRRTVGTGAEVGGEEGDAGSTGGAAGGEAAAAELPALPSTLKLCSIKSLQMEKDVHAYLFCATYPGRTLIFVNAIAIARRLSSLLCTLNVPATPLHAQMQQRQRLKSLDRFTSDPKAVLVATDVAARGLDIPKVEHVVHYDAARSAEVFIHRAGRTARARAAGLSLSIVAPRDDANHRQTCSVLGLHDGMQAFPQDMRMVERARERVGMALRVLKFQEAQSRVSASNDFFRGLSREADLVMDGDLLMEDAGAKPDPAAQGRGGVKGLGKKGNQHAARLAAEARQALAASLSRPLHSDRRKLIPVAQALADMRAVSERTAAGDLAGKRKTRSGKQAVQ